MLKQNIQFQLLFYRDFLKLKPTSEYLPKSLDILYSADRTRVALFKKRTFVDSPLRDFEARFTSLTNPQSLYYKRTTLSISFVNQNIHQIGLKNHWNSECMTS